MAMVVSTSIDWTAKKIRFGKQVVIAKGRTSKEKAV